MWTPQTLTSSVVNPVRTSPWVASLPWDSFWLLSGFWLPLWVLIPVAWGEPLVWCVTLLFWIAHRLSSTYLAWCVSEYRSVVRQNRAYFIGWPLALLAGFALFLLPPESVIPLSRIWRFGLLAAVDYFWSLYHFARQHYGVLAIYRSRQRKDPAQLAFNPGLLRWDGFLCLGVSGFLSVCMDLHYGEFEPLRLWQDWVGGKNSGLWTSQASLFKTVLSAVVFGFWGTTLYYYRQQRQSVARMLYASSLCAMTLVSFYVSPVLYFILIQIQHWLVSLGLTQYMASRSRTRHSGPWYGFWQRINAWPLGALGALVLASVLLMPFLEADAYLLHQLDSSVLARWDGSFGLYVLGLLAFWSAYVHYLYDRGVFRFSDAKVRQAAFVLLAAGPNAAAGASTDTEL